MSRDVRPVAGLAGVVTLALAAYLTPSPEGTVLIKQSEGLELKAYPDAVQIPTICWGSTSGVRLGQTATLQECEARLLLDATYAGQALSKHVHVPLSQRQYDALVSFVYNVGETQFRTSTLLRKLNAKDCYGAAAQFDRWVFAKGTKLNGLVTRRAKERNLFVQDCWAWGQP